MKSIPNHYVPKIEQALMFLCLNGDENYKEIAPQLIDEHFADDTALKAFKVINAIMKDGKQPTFVTFGKYALSEKTLTANEIASVTQWGNELSYSEPINEYISILKDEHIKRNINHILTEEALGLGKL